MGDLPCTLHYDDGKIVSTGIQVPITLRALGVAYMERTTLLACNA